MSRIQPSPSRETDLDFTMRPDTNFQKLFYAAGNVSPTEVSPSKRKVVPPFP